MTCDNGDGAEIVGCKYNKRVGTTFSEEVSHTISVSAAVSVTTKTNFFGLFKGELSVSVETGYDWTKTSTETQSEEVEYEVQITRGAFSQF